jgi:hypothetical protein
MQMCFDNFLSEVIYILNGIGQGDPLSMILYILYDADLLEVALPLEEEALSFVDNALAMVVDKMFDDNINMLIDFINMERGSFAWSDDHNSPFALDKLAVTHFTQKRILDPQHPGKTVPLLALGLYLKDKLVCIEPSYKHLGIHVDSQLCWTTQMHKAIAKATKWIMLYRRLTKPSLGLSAKFMRRLYITVAILKMTYGLDVWYMPPHKPLCKKKNSGSIKALREFHKLQRVAMLAINGTLRTPPINLLDSHAGLLPADLLLKKICYRSMIQVCTLLPTNPFCNQVVKYLGLLTDVTI